MQESNYLDTPDSPDERMQKRRARRWKRRGRIVGPFVGVLLLLATLTLSVDLIEYQPQPPAERLSDRPLPEAVVASDTKRSARPNAAVFSAASVVDSKVTDPAARTLEDARGAALDLTLAPVREIGAPPYAPASARAPATTR